MRAIDADALEKEGWSLHRTIRVDKNTSEYQTMPLANVPDINVGECEDTISRQQAIDFIDAGHLVNPNEPRWSDNEVVNFLKSRPPAQPEQRWIPCSEMMPVSDGIYIVDDYRHDKHWIHTVGYMKRSNSWCEQHGIYYDDKYGRYDKQEDIIAWMPLPEPYGGEQE